MDGKKDGAADAGKTSAEMMTPQGGVSMADLEEQLRAADGAPEAAESAEKPEADKDREERGEPAKKPEAEEEREERGERDRLTPEQQEAVDRRIGKEVAKRKSLEEQLEAAQAEVEEARADLAAARNDATSAAGLHPLLAAESEKDLADYEEYLDQVDDWTEAHRNGYEGSDDAKDKSYTPEEIAARRVRLRQERRLLDRARDLFRQREASRSSVQEVYPDLLDRSTEMGRETQRILARIPGLKASPEGLMLVGDALAGRRLRTKKETKPGAGGPERAPRLPIDNRGAGPGRPHEERPPAKGAINVGRMVEAGGGVDALEAELEASM